MQRKKRALLAIYKNFQAGLGGQKGPNQNRFNVYDFPSKSDLVAADSLWGL